MMKITFFAQKPNKSVEPINYPAGNSSAHFKRYVHLTYTKEFKYGSS